MSTPAWRIAIKSILLFNLVLFALLGILVLVTAADSVVVLLPIVLTGLVLGVVTTLILWLVRRYKTDHPPMWRTWLNTSVVLTLVLLSLAAVPFLSAVFYNATQPLAVPRITLTNGEKEIVFQGMVHVGSEPFYQSVVFDMVRAADQGYVLLIEGVLPGSARNESRLNEMIGTKDASLSQVYDAVARSCNLKFQEDYFDIFIDDMMEDPEQFVNADVTVDDMFTEWDRLVAVDPSLETAQTPARTQEKTDQLDTSISKILDNLEKLSPGQSSLVALACQTMFNMSLGEQEITEPFMKRIVLEYRDQRLVETILDQPKDRLYIAYGSNHIAGVFRLLQESDPNWEIADVRWIQAIENRDELERVLMLED